MTDKLLGSDVIGINAEYSSEQEIPYSIIQLSNKNEAFLIELMSLGSCSKLNNCLTEIVSSEKTTIVGFDFEQHLKNFETELPDLSFVKKIFRYLDLKNAYQDWLGLNEKKQLD